MAGVVVVMAIVVFASGVLIGAIAALAMGVHRKHWRYALTGAESSRLATYTRRLSGLGRRT